MKKVIKNTLPKGVSKWKQEGIKYGYWDFFTKETEKAFGGCKKCYGKGYGTSLKFEGTSRSLWKLPEMVFCGCDRGKQLERQVEQIEERLKNDYLKRLKALEFG